MEKILSICIPSYNMEKYLRRNLESFLVPECLDALELIVVNDGSKDKTLEIANEYKAKYPDTVVVIDKANGHYGSCVNAAIKIATGKYFRIVDADDWVNGDSLRRFVEVLKRNNSECFITRYSKFFEKTGLTKPMQMTTPEVNKVLSIDDIEINPTFLHMHCITWNLDYIKSIKYVQDEGVCYTDLEYACIPFMSTKSVYFTDIDLYQYYIGRNDQSVAPAVVNKNFSHFIKVYNRLDSYKFGLMNTKAEVIRKKFIQLVFGFMTPSHIFYNYKNKDNDSFLRSEVGKHLHNGYGYHDFVFSGSEAMAKYVKMWFEPNLINNIILSIQRWRINRKES